jgi:hypothetical protein
LRRKRAVAARIELRECEQGSFPLENLSFVETYA